MNKITSSLDARVINIASISEIDEKLIPIFQDPQFKTYNVNMTAEVAIYLFREYQELPKEHPDGFIMFVKSLRQRECYKDGTAWERSQILEFLIDCMTQEILQAKIGRPTDTPIDDLNVHIDDMQTRWTHYTEFVAGGKNYKFTLDEVKDCLNNDMNLNMNSLKEIRPELDSLVSFMENQTNPIQLTYDLLKPNTTLKYNFDETIFSCKLSIKPNSYLAKSFINDNMTTTTLTKTQVLMTKGTVLPDEEYSWTENIRPIIDEYSGRPGSKNQNNPMFDGSRKTPAKYGGAPIAKQSHILKKGKNVGQLSSLMMGQILNFQNEKGKLDLKKKLWEFDGNPFVLKSWRKVVHISDVPHGEWAMKRFTEADLKNQSNRKAYKNKAGKIVERVNDICYAFATDKDLRIEADNFKKFFLSQYEARHKNRNDHHTPDILKMFSFGNVENAKLLFSELVRNSFTYKIDILKENKDGVQKSRFIQEYLKTLYAVARKRYNTDKRVNELSNLKSTIGNQDYSTTYEARLPIWKELLELTEEAMKDNPIYKSSYDKTRNVNKSERDVLSDMFVDAWRAVERIQPDDGLLYVDSEWGDVTIDNFHHGHTISKKDMGSASAETSVVQHPTRNMKAGATTQGDTTLPKPAQYYGSVIAGLEHRLEVEELSRDEKRRIDGSIDVLEYIIQEVI